MKMKLWEADNKQDRHVSAGTTSACYT